MVDKNIPKDPTLHQTAETLPPEGETPSWTQLKHNTGLTTLLLKESITQSMSLIEMKFNYFILLKEFRLLLDFFQVSLSNFENHIYVALDYNSHQLKDTACAWEILSLHIFYLGGEGVAGHWGIKEHFNSGHPE